MPKDDFVVIDTETGSFIDGVIVPELNAQKMLLGGVLRSSRKKPVWFNNPNEMMNYLDELQKEKAKQGKNLYVYGHNALYDYCAYAKDYVSDVGKIKVIRQRPFYAILNPPKEGERKKIGFLLDTLSFYNQPLEEVGKSLKINKPELPKGAKDINELKVRCYSDLLITQEAIRGIFRTCRDLGWNVRKLTTASRTAMTYFRTECRKRIYCKKCDITWKIKNTTNKKELTCNKCGNKGGTFSGYLYKNNKIYPTRHNNFLRDAYYGARNEVGIKGYCNNLTQIDINAEFPYCMVNMECPDLQSEYKMSEDEIRAYSNEKIINDIARIGVIEATIFCPERKDKIGYLPVRIGNRSHCVNKFVRDQDELIGRLKEFENTEDIIKSVKDGLNGGIVRGKWHSLLLRGAIKEGYKILKIHNVVKYRQLPFNPFKEILGNLFERRKKEEDPIMKNTIKLLMNSLYGKFGETIAETHTERCHRKDCESLMEKGYKIEANIGEEYIMVKELGRRIPKHAHPMISLTTTAMAFDLIYNEISKIPKEDFFYVDTDSIIMKDFDKNESKFKFGDNMGEWKIVSNKNILLKNVEGFMVREKVYRMKDKEIGSTTTRMSGIRPITGNREKLTDKQVRGEEKIKSLKMYTPKMGRATNRPDKVGTFFEEEKKMRSDNLKMDILMPVYHESKPNPKGKIEDISTL